MYLRQTPVHDPVAPKDGEVDTTERVEELKKEIQEVAGTEAIFGHIDDSTGLEVPFLEYVLAFEKENGSEEANKTYFERLIAAGVELPAPDDLGDEEVAARIREIAGQLAEWNAYLYHSDHLSDRQLYELLHDDLLRERSGPMGIPGTTTHLDVIGSGSPEDTELYLRYYASEQCRQRWKDSFPDYVLPNRKELAYDRDRHLPGRPAPTDGDQG